MKISDSSDYINVEVNKALEFLRGNSDHHLNANIRIGIYASFGPSFQHSFDVPPLALLYEKKISHFSLTAADYALSWLAIITARKVLPISYPLQGAD